MNSTRLSLIEMASSGSTAAWYDLVGIYQPFVFGWLRKQDIHHHDAEELAQDVMSTVFRELPKFSHVGRVGSFRKWLRQMTLNRTRNYWRAKRNRPVATGSSTFRQIVQQLKDEKSDLSRQWDEEHDNFILRQLLRELAVQLDPQTLRVFRMLVVEEVPPQDVAMEMNMRVAAVYSAKSRVMRKLRQSAKGLIDESVLA